MNEGEASTTAQRVAAHRLAFPRVEAPFGRPEDDLALHQAVAAAITVDSTTPMARYLRARTTSFDQVVVDAIATGIGQIVAVGAGYDGRSLRYAHRDVRWFELDHPDTQADKQAQLAALGVDVSSIAFASADFATDAVAPCLLAAGLDPAARTLFLCEGVASYLDLRSLTSLLRALASTAAADSTLAISVSLDPVSEPQEHVRARLGDAVAAMGEALQSSIPRQGLASWFLDAGWTVRRATDPAGVPVAASPRTGALVLAAPAG